MGRGLRNSDFSASVIDALTSQICVLDADGAIIAVNSAWQSFGSDNGRDGRRSDIGVNYLDICWSAAVAGIEGAQRFHDGLLAVLNGSLDIHRQEYACHGGGRERWFLVRVSPIRRKSTFARTTRPNGAVISHSEITDRVLLERELKRQAGTDQLTGLANRRAFFEAANASVADVQASRRSASIIMLDVDDFKLVNDRYGHAGGDAALQTIAEVILRLAPSPCLAARLGGEEFAVLVSHQGGWEATLLAERIRRHIAEVVVAGPTEDFSVTASFGVSEVSCDDVTADEVLLRADRALYRAKADGRNCVRVYAPYVTDDQQALPA
jgi:diguanylate cyclase (GGDEF)-like protein